MAFPDFLIHQSLNASHDRRGERCSSRSRPLIGRFGAGSTSGSAKAKRVIVVPNSVCGKQRYVGSIAHSVAGISEQRLIRRLRITGARSTNNTRLRWRSRRALARSAAASRRPQKPRRLGAVAEATRSVRFAKTFESREQHAGAGSVPGNLGDIRQRRFIGRGIGSAPVSAVCPGISIAEVGTANGHVIGSLSPARDSDASRGISITSGATRGIGISRGNENRHAFGDRLLKGCVE